MSKMIRESREVEHLSWLKRSMNWRGANKSLASRLHTPSQAGDEWVLTDGHGQIIFLTPCI